jgi:hypothetical protein
MCTRGIVGALMRNKSLLAHTGNQTRIPPTFSPYRLRHVGSQSVVRESPEHTREVYNSQRALTSKFPKAIAAVAESDKSQLTERNNVKGWCSWDHSCPGVLFQ